MKFFTLACATLALSLSTLLSTQASAQYRWTDANGKVNYGDTPPAGAKDVQRMGGDAPASSTAPDPSLPYELRIAAERFPVTLYTTANCAPCDQARGFLQRRGVPFSEKTVRYKEETELMQRTGLGGTEFPVATIGRQTKRGFKEAEWTLELNASGYPAKSQLPPQWKPAPAQPLMDLPKPGTPAAADTTAESAEPTPAPTPAIKRPFGG